MDEEINGWMNVDEEYYAFYPVEEAQNIVNDPNETICIDEGVIGDFINTQIKLSEMKSKWNEAIKNFVSHRWIQRFITPQQEDMLKKYYDMVSREDVSYGEYKKGFNFICKFMGLPNKGIMMEHVEFKDDPKDNGSRIVALCYSKGQAKVKIPEGISLIHVSPVDGIQSLNPSFRNKKLGHFMYPSKRVFFTIAKDVEAKSASLSGVKTYRYRAKGNIPYGYIDPACNSFATRAIYIETDTPIPVERYDKFLDKLIGDLTGKNKKQNDIQNQDIDDQPPKKDKSKNEAYNFLRDRYNNLIIESEYENLEEGFKEFIDGIRSWKSSHTRDLWIKNYSSNSVLDTEYAQMEQLLDTMKNAEDYQSYKKAFDKFCLMCHIVPKGTVLYPPRIKKGKNPDENEVSVSYGYNTRKITLDPEAQLYHYTTVSGIKALNPSFRSKLGFYYDCPRVYFTLNKKMIKAFADYAPGTKTFQYTPTAPISQVIIDPLVRDPINKAVYVETKKPIPVKQLTFGKEDPNGPKPNMKDQIRSDDKVRKESTEFDPERMIEFGTIFGLDIEPVEESKFDISNDILFTNESFIKLLQNGEKRYLNKAIMETGNDYLRKAFDQISFSYNSTPMYKKFIDSFAGSMPQLECSNTPEFRRHITSLAAAARYFDEYVQDKISQDTLKEYLTPCLEINQLLAQDQIALAESTKDIVERQVIDQYVSVHDVLGMVNN